mmetsp:Transcript_843/g.3506  ORF Transcript_843/g.3506 Transcript_843/m.3506 type:complete len:89 (-) Transcript_843:51-317(-)
MQQQHSHPNQLGKESLIGVASSSSEIMAEIKDIKGRIEELVETRRVQDCEILDSMLRSQEKLQHSIIENFGAGADALVDEREQEAQLS